MESKVQRPIGHYHKDVPACRKSGKAGNISIRKESMYSCLRIARYLPYEGGD
ncbi:MAG: hypothetical protein HXS48_15410 [Theionarchaea archaeon]|nr:hypothetical protein [Theionarchaea archaeon]